MADSAEPKDIDRGLKAEIEALDVAAYEPSGNGDEYDGFAGMFVRLPKFPFVNAGGADMRIRWLESSQESLTVRPIANYAGNLVVRKLTETGSRTTLGQYFFLYGSLLASEVDTAQHGWAPVGGAIGQIICGNQQIVDRILVNGEPVVDFAYAAHSFCKDGRLVYSRAFTTGEIESPEFRSRTSLYPTYGNVLTVQRGVQGQLPLFVELPPAISPAMTNVDWRAGGNGEFVPVLSF